MSEQIYSQRLDRDAMVEVARLDRIARAEQNELDRASQELQTEMLAKALDGIRHAILGWDVDE